MSIVILVLIGLVGIGAAFFSSKFVDRFAHIVIAVMAAGSATFTLLGPISKIPQMVKMGLMVCACFAAGYFSHLAERYIKAIGTAFVGSFLLMHGISMYAGGFPQLSDVEVSDGEQITKITTVTKQMIGYVAGMVLCTGLGGFIQLKYVVEHREEKDDFMNQDNSWKLL